MIITSGPGGLLAKRNFRHVLYPCIPWLLQDKVKSTRDDLNLKCLGVQEEREQLWL